MGKEKSFVKHQKVSKYYQNDCRSKFSCILRNIRPKRGNGKQMWLVQKTAAESGGEDLADICSFYLH